MEKEDKQNNIGEQFIFMSAVLLLIRGTIERGTELEDCLEWLEEIIADHKEGLKENLKQELNKKLCED